MIHKLTIAAAVALTPAVAFALPSQGDRELTVSGSGSSDNDFESNSLGATIGYGYFINDRTEVGIRQSLNLADNEDEDVWNAATRIYADYHFGTTGPWQPFVGGNIGAIYGENVNDTFAAGPEAGIKYYIHPQAFLLAEAEYQFLFEEAEDADEAFDDGAFLYTLGVGVNF